MNKFFFFLVFILFALSMYSQSAIEIVPTGSASIFEKHQQNTLFLNKKIHEIDSISKLFNPFFSKSPKEIDTQELYALANASQQSFQEFTNYNSKRLVEIDKELIGNKPIKGSDIAYLHHSFQVYKKYIYMYIGIENNLKYVLKETEDKQLSNLFLYAKLSPISFFYKNYYPVIKNTRIRRVINASDATFNIKDNDFKKLVKKELKGKKFNKIKKSIKELSPAIDKLLDSALVKEINKSSYFESRIKKDKNKMTRFFRKDNRYQIQKFFTHHLSGIIGNVAGAVRFRKGYLYKNDSIHNLIKSKLKPMDIIAEKTGFALTDKMIPGHFGHIAIWLGTETQLKEIKIWETLPELIQQKISEGHVVLESARNGTHLLKLDKFINVDELAIARINTFSSLSFNEKDLLYKHAIAQLGKAYDFNFDVETSDKLVCSELLYQVFGSIYWPTDKFLQRSTISPDNVLSLALYKNTPIDLTYYVEGKSKRIFCEKSLDILAKELSFEKQGTGYVLPDISCKDVKVKGKNRKVEKCKRVYHQLVYEE